MEQRGSSSETAPSEDQQKGKCDSQLLEGDGKTVIKFSDLVNQFLHSLPLDREWGGRKDTVASVAVGRGNELSRIIGLVPLLPLFNLFVCMFSRAEKAPSPSHFSFN